MKTTKIEFFVAFAVLFCLVKAIEGQRPPPKVYAKIKCERRVKNETLLEKCKSCVEQYSLRENPSKSEISKLYSLERYK
ncbi:hypothetical protein JTE90_000511 [Oedothorax gibbosus]|uniref:Uncharacterized protein n=1 Tax=Oedothorax gibbosus TaxID=931172 RepID=A0AAV6VW52_9ARAC|nr:hypothetical protein JTE90_000511 [Oedothorax gibbosus]